MEKFVQGSALENGFVWDSHPTAAPRSKGDLDEYQWRASDGLQLTLRFSFQPRLTPDVRQHTNRLLHLNAGLYLRM